MKETKQLEIHLHLQTYLPHPEAIWISFIPFHKKSVKWAGHNLQFLPQRMSVIKLSDMFWEDRAIGSPAWGQHCWAFIWGKEAHTTGPHH